MRRLFVIVICFFAGSPCVWAASKIKVAREARKLYSEEKYSESLEKYSEALGKDSESDIINFGLGTAYYKSNQFPMAIEHLQRSLLTEDPSLQQKTYYNLGNAFFKEGIGREDKDPGGAIASLEKSLSQYDKALNLDSQDPDAKFNHDFVAKELERLKKKQQEQKQNQQNRQNQDKENQEEQKKQDQKQDQQKDPKSQEPQKQDSSKQPSGSDQKKQEDQSQPDQEQKQEPQDNKRKDEGSQQEQDGSQENRETRDNQQPHSGGQLDAGEELPFTNQEARRALEEYIQVEEPKGLFNPLMNQSRQNDVQKDW